MIGVRAGDPLQMYDADAADHPDPGTYDLADVRTLIA
jgi:hypothetical protein